MQRSCAPEQLARALEWRAIDAQSGDEADEQPAPFRQSQDCAGSGADSIPEVFHHGLSNRSPEMKTATVSFAMKSFALRGEVSSVRVSS